MIGADETLRADARVNRDRILSVAREALAADPDASLNLIAKRAGVGAGTLYRHFPNRDALLVGVYGKEIEALVTLAPTLLGEHKPLRAFRLWCDRMAEASRMKHGIADALRAAIPGQNVQEAYQAMVLVIGQMIKACEDSADIRPGADAGDILALLGVLWRLPPDAAGRAQADRLISLIFRGLS